MNPIAAATHANPYPYYADLVANKPLYYDEALGLWVASSAEVINEALHNPDCRVRPVAEPVPTALLNSSLGIIFQQLIRMNDGAMHCPFKRAISATLDSVNDTKVLSLSRRWADRLLSQSRVHLADVPFSLSAYVIGELLGLPETQLAQTAAWIGAVAPCIAPGSSAAQISEGKAAAAQIFAAFTHLLEENPQSNGLLAQLAAEARPFAQSHTTPIIANGIGLLIQAYDATAGLIGNTLLALKNNPTQLAHARADSELLPSIIQETARHDAPIQNTRRFLAQESRLGGQTLPAGATALLVLAAANRDAAANPRPDIFDPQRASPQLFTFGAGKHACPGDRLAYSIALAAVERLIDALAIEEPVRYRPAQNARIALIGV